MNKSASKTLYLPIEIVERELDSKLLLAIEAIEREYEVYIGNYMTLPELAKKIGSGFYIYKAMTDYRAEKLFKPLSDCGVNSGVLDEEGLIFPSIDYYIKTRIGEGKSFQYLSSVFTWGKYQEKEILSSFDLNKSLVRTTGNPRIDLIRQPYRKIYCEKADSLIGEYGDFVLINTNFAPGNYSPIFKYTYHEHMRYFGRINNDNDEKYYTERTSYYENLYKTYVEMVKSLSLAIPNTKIVVRPHPSEDHNAWRCELQGLDNVEVVYEGNVIEWLVAAKCVIHTGCTTGVEAFILEKPIFRFNPDLRLDMESELPNRLGESFQEKTQLISRVRKYLSAPDSYLNSKEQTTYLKNWIENLSGEYAHKRIMNEIDAGNLCTEGTVKSTKYVTVRDVYKLIRKNLIAILEQLKIFQRFDFINGLIVRQRQRNQRFSGISLKKIKVRLKAFQEFSEAISDKQVEVKRVGVDIYRIKLK